VTARQPTPAPRWTAPLLLAIAAGVSGFVTQVPATIALWALGAVAFDAWYSRPTSR
jgi:hypothetical protein